MGHARGGRGAMPVLVTRRAPDHVAGTDLHDRLALALGPSAAGGDDQGLAQRMGVPGGARARLERDARAGDAGRGRRRVQDVETDGSREVLRGSLLRRLRSGALDLHGGLLVAGATVGQASGRRNVDRSLDQADGPPQ